MTQEEWNAYIFPIFALKAFIDTVYSNTIISGVGCVFKMSMYLMDNFLYLLVGDHRYIPHAFVMLLLHRANFGEALAGVSVVPADGGFPCG